ncbi:MAG: gliding motility-associated lipoprotein, partial [Bacteroidia bacterium]|nr:gliding motility-associated lipoprotein [Bacteroidia bacterium]
MNIKNLGNKKVGFLFMIALITLTGCGSGNKGELTGVLNREKWYQADPFGMVYIPAGSFNMGPSDQDVPYAVTAQAKTVTIPAFYMDNTE